ncbi:MAG: hypothetical protein JRK53_25615 [Deltaproteobacteria bacterium]|nr:hypothetical protein [Deltaproteobacteria bacterium]
MITKPDGSPGFRRVLDADDTSASHIWGQLNSWLPQTGTVSVVPTGVPFEHVTLQNPKDPT